MLFHSEKVFLCQARTSLNLLIVVIIFNWLVMVHHRTFPNRTWSSPTPPLSVFAPRVHKKQNLLACTFEVLYLVLSCKHHQFETCPWKSPHSSSLQPVHLAVDGHYDEGLLPLLHYGLVTVTRSKQVRPFFSLRLLLLADSLRIGHIPSVQSGCSSSGTVLEVGSTLHTSRHAILLVDP